MIRKFFTFTIFILAICSLPFFESQESRAESLVRNDTLVTQNSQADLRVIKGENYTKPGITPKIDSPTIQPDQTVILGDGFYKGKIAGNWVGKQIRNYVCDWLSLECPTRVYTEYE